MLSRYSTSGPVHESLRVTSKEAIFQWIALLHELLGTEPDGSPVRPMGRVGVGNQGLIEAEQEHVTVEEAFDISEEIGEGSSTVSVVGEIDIATAPALRETLESVIDRGAPVLVVDLLGVTFIDSTALGVLIGALKRCNEAGGAMRIAVSDARVLKVFEITGLTDLFSIHPTLEGAAQG